MFIAGSLASHYAEHRRMPGFKDFSFPQVHVHTTGQAWIEASHRPHNVDAFELLRPVLFEDGRVLHRVFVRTGGAVDVARIGVPAGGRIRMIVSDLAIANDNVMRQDTANGFMEP